MTYVMSLVKIGDNPEQGQWQIATFAKDPRRDGFKIGGEYQFDDEPDEKWRIADIFRDQA